MTDPNSIPAGLRGAVDLSALVNRANAPQAANSAPAAGGPAAPTAGGTAPGSPAEGGVGGPAPEGGIPLVFATDDAHFEQVLQLSSQVPVVVEFVVPGLEPGLIDIVTSYGGRLVLAVVDAQASQQLAQAFQLREVPAAAAVIGGRPVNLFPGRPEEDQIRQVLDELLQLAAENGVTGTVPGGAPADGEGSEEPEEPPLPPLHQEAFDAISAGDFAGAIAAYDKALAQNPRDTDAVAGRAQASLLGRLAGQTAEQIRAAAADAPSDVPAQLAVADLDLSGGHLDDAFGRLLDVFPAASPEDRDALRARLLEYFELAGADDPRVASARVRLASLLY